MSNDETVTGIILARLERIEAKLDSMQTSGCAKAEKHERTANKIVVKERDKGSKRESDWKTSKEFPLMFGNNRLGRKPKDNKK